MMTVPVITIFARHRIHCLHAGEEFYKRCSCWKHLRWSYGGKQYRKATKQRTWTGAERFKREVELAYEKGGQPARWRKQGTPWETILGAIPHSH